jgi:hypothetical protein
MRESTSQKARAMKARDMNKKNGMLTTPPQRLGVAGRATGGGRGRGM